MRGIPKEKLSKKIIKAWRLGGVGYAFLIALLLSPSVLLYLWAGAPIMLPRICAIITLVCLILFVFVVPPLRWRYFSYAVYEDEIDIYKGVLVKKRIIVPLVRVQYTDTSQGPIMRMVGLAQVDVSTAAGNQSIPGLIPSDADRVRDRVVELAKLVHENV